MENLDILVSALKSRGLRFEVKDDVVYLDGNYYTHGYGLTARPTPKGFAYGFSILHEVSSGTPEENARIVAYGIESKLGIH